MDRLPRSCSAKPLKTIPVCVPRFGLLVCRDSRVSDAQNSHFLDMMESYYEQDDAIKAKDARPEMFYQVGVTPELVELPRNHCAKIHDEYEASAQCAGSRPADESGAAAFARAALGSAAHAMSLSFPLSLSLSFLRGAGR